MPPGVENPSIVPSPEEVLSFTNTNNSNNNVNSTNNSSKQINLHINKVNSNTHINDNTIHKQITKLGVVHGNNQSSITDSDLKLKKNLHQHQNFIDTSSDNYSDNNNYTIPTITISG